MSCQGYSHPATHESRCGDAVTNIGAIQSMRTESERSRRPATSRSGRTRPRRPKRVSIQQGRRREAGAPRRTSHRAPISPICCHPKPSIWVAESVQAAVRAKGLAEEIPANRWWAHLDSNQGPLPYQGGVPSTARSFALRSVPAGAARERCSGSAQRGAEGRLAGASGGCGYRPATRDRQNSQSSGGM